MVIYSNIIFSIEYSYFGFIRVHSGPFGYTSQYEIYMIITHDCTRDDSVKQFDWGIGYAQRNGLILQNPFCDFPGTFWIIGYCYEDNENNIIENALDKTGLYCTNAIEISHNILLNMDKLGCDEHGQNNSVCSYFYHNCATTNETLTFDHSLGFPIANSSIIQNSSWNLVDYGYFSVGIHYVEAVR